MKLWHIFSVFLLMTSCVDDSDAQQKRRANKTKTNATKKIEKPVAAPDAAPQTAFKILAESTQSDVEQPFVFVARDETTFSLLKKLLPELPSENVNFKNSAVVAAFLGTKPTGGYSVSIVKTGEGGARISAVNPPRDAITTDALTAPFAVAVVPSDEEQTLSIEVGAEWSRAAQKYRITTGEFGFSGGFAGIKKSFPLEGVLNVWRAGDLVTIDFGATGKGAERGRKMDEIASGNLKGNDLTLPRFDAGTLVDPPRPALKASGTLNDKEISLSFDSLPTNYADGFAGSGKLKAIK
jgi:hypothetical protein